MGFATYSGNMYSMIAEICAQLIAADPAAFAAVTTGSADKACVHYLTEDKYIQFICKSYSWYNGNTYYYYSVQVDIGGSYNNTTHEVETGVQKYNVMLNRIMNDNSKSTLLFNDRTLSHTLWIDKHGFSWNCWNPYTDYEASGFLMNMAFVPVAFKEYNDGSSRIIITNTESPSSSAGTLSNVFKNGQYGVFQSDSNLWELNNSEKSFKSLGNNKVYYNFVKFHKNPTTYTNPILINKRLFLSNKAGLAVNDVLSWIDPIALTTRKYILTELGSGRGTDSIYYALPYENAFVYE